LHCGFYKTGHGLPVRWLLAAMILTLLVGGGSWARAGGAPAQLTNQALVLYEQRADLRVAAQAVALYHKVLADDPGDLDASLKLCELLVWIGAQSTSPDEEAYYRELITVAEQARRMHPQDPGPVYWLGVGQGMLATVASIPEALGLVKKARVNMRLLLSMDPTYCHGGADRVLGRIYSKLPFFIGGSNEKAESHYKQAIDRGPHYWLNHLYLAELYHHEGDDAKAKQLLRQVAAGPTIHGLEPECRLWQEVARKYLVRGDSFE
jgi:tetratricopeptide (TPR) repeat protein